MHLPDPAHRLFAPLPRRAAIGLHGAHPFSIAFPAEGPDDRDET